MSEQVGTPTEPTAPEGAAGAAPEAGNTQIGELIEGFKTFQGEVMSRFETLENDLFEPEGGQPLPGAPDFPVTPGVQPGVTGQPPIPAQPGGVPPGVQQGAPQYPAQPQAPVAPQLPPEAEQVLSQFIDGRVQVAQQQLDQRVQAALSADARQRELDSYADGLESRYEEFKDEAATKRLLEATAAFAQELGHPELSSDPRLLERVLLTERAQAAAGGGEPNEVHLETTSAAPSGSPGEVDPAAGIVAAAKGKQLF